MRIARHTVQLHRREPDGAMAHRACDVCVAGIPEPIHAFLHQHAASSSAAARRSTDAVNGVILGQTTDFDDLPLGSRIERTSPHNAHQKRTQHPIARSIIISIIYSI